MKHTKAKKEESDEEFEIKANDMGDMPSELGRLAMFTNREEEYDEDSETDSTLEGESRKRQAQSYRGHPWSDDDEAESSVRGTVRTKRTKVASETETTRRSTRRRRQNYSPQDLLSLDSSDKEEDEAHSYQYTMSPVAMPDSGSRIERIIGRRALPNTKEADEIMRRSRYAIVASFTGLHPREFMETKRRIRKSPCLKIWTMLRLNTS